MARQPGIADRLVRCLEREGVTTVLGVPGKENIGFVDAVLRSPIRNATANSSPVVASPAQAGRNRIYEQSSRSVSLMSMFSPMTKCAGVMLTPGAVR